MAEIAIRLEPRKLDNPDLDLRYLLPETLAARFPDLLESSGYDYAPNECILVFLTTASPDVAVAKVLATLETLELLGNHFRGVTVAVASSERSVRGRLDQYTVVAPQPGARTLADPLELPLGDE